MSKPVIHFPLQINIVEFRDYNGPGLESRMCQNALPGVWHVVEVWLGRLKERGRNARERHGKSLVVQLYISALTYFIGLLEGSSE